MTPKFLQVKRVVYKHPSRYITAGVNGVSFELAKGETLVVIGESGAGKSTLLKCIYGLVDLQSGTILMEEKKVTGPSLNLIPGHKRMKLVDQQFNLRPNQTVFENVEMCLPLYHTTERHNKVNALLRRFKLHHEKTKKAHELSGGQQQRLALARALAEQPELLLLDEPFSNLDSHIKHEISADISASIQEEDMSCIMVTHDVQEALRIADKIIVLHKGKVLQKGSPEDIYSSPKNQYVADLTGWNYPYTDDTGSTHFLRPEQLKIDSKNGQQAQWIRQEYEGFGYQQLFKLGDTIVRVRTSLPIEKYPPPHYIIPILKTDPDHPET